MRFFGFQRRASEKISKDSLYFDFEEAFAAEECPVCHLLDLRERRYIESIFYESVNDPGVRKKFRQAGGLCKRHTQLLIDLGDILGLAIIGKDLMTKYADHPPQNPPEPGCPLCNVYEENERRLTGAFSRYLAIPDFWGPLARSVGLCRRHFGAVLRELSSKEVQEKLIHFQRDKIQALLKQLETVIQKNDYRFQTEKITEAEGKAVKIAWDLLKK
ncbi:MAG: hypothetical protein GXO76_12860 [Calditrichaeota bacterium]|nr:hypothetical protein [Calditrichota bacterium]